MAYQRKGRCHKQIQGFFLPTRNAHLDRFYIKTCNILSSDPRSPSIYRLLSMIKDNNLLDIKVEEVKKLLKGHRKIIEGIEQYCIKRAAHWDIGSLGQRKSVFFGKCKELPKELEDISNEISGAYSHKIWSLRPLQHDGTLILISKLKEIQSKAPTPKS